MLSVKTSSRNSNRKITEIKSTTRSATTTKTTGTLDYATRKSDVVATSTVNRTNSLIPTSCAKLPAKLANRKRRF